MADDDETDAMSSRREHPSVTSAGRIADEVLFPTAQEVDRLEIVPRARFADLASAGLFGIAGPSGVDPHVARRTMATIAGGCGVTFFCWVQHHGVVRTIADSPNEELRARWLAPMCAGGRLAGVAFAHLRRRDRPSVTATRVDDGWRLDGFAPWATSWGVADVFAVAAATDDGSIVWLLVDGAPQEGLVTSPLHLPVLSATGTVSMRFEGLVVPDDGVASIGDLEAWRRSDRRRAAPGAPAVLGVADRAVRLLRDAARSDDDPATETAARLADELEACWRRDDDVVAELAASATDEGDDHDDDHTTTDTDAALVGAASEHRAHCLALGEECTRALLAATGGGGMDLAHPARRLAREALFYVIQAQTDDGRNATLRSIRPAR